MEFLTNQLLVEAYVKAKALDLDPDFILLLQDELKRRKIQREELERMEYELLLNGEERDLSSASNKGNQCDM